MLAQWNEPPPPRIEEYDDDEEDDEEAVKYRRRRGGDEGDDEGDDDEDSQSSDDELTTVMETSIKKIQSRFKKHYTADLSQCMKENFCCAVQQAQSVMAEQTKSFAKLPFKEVGSSKPEGASESTKVPVTSMGKAASLPVSINYVNIRRNAMIEDEKALRFLPYFGENDNIKLDFNAYSSDEESDIEAAVDDDTVLAITEHYGTSQRTLESLSEAIGFSYDAVKQRLNELTFASERRMLEQRQMLYFHGFDCESTDMLTDSYQKLFCRRCSNFDCRYHGLFQPRPCCGRDDRRFFVDSSMQQALQLFQDDASLVTPALPTAVTNKRRKREAQAPQYCNGVWTPPPSLTTCASCPDQGTQFRDWTAPQSALFRKLWFVFGAKFCSIAQVMGVPCADVREHAAALPFLLLHRSLAHSVGADEEKKKKGVRAVHSKATSPPQHFACNHLGACNAECSCVSNGMFCEIYCPCDKECRNRFLGCVCKTLCRTRACPCFAANRECTPGLCEGCVTTAPPGEQCCNISIQTRNFKQVLLARSTVHGWGAFLGSEAMKNDLITEYLGEVITQEEADRRGKIYDKLNRSYLFQLNESYVVDAARKGNKIKFANHSTNPNCFSRVMMVNGDHRIGIYAKKKIRKGEELFFDYQHEHLGHAPEWFATKKQKGKPNSNMKAAAACKSGFKKTA